MATGRSNVGLGGLSPSGEATASGAVFLLDDAHVIYREVQVDSATRDSMRNPNTTLEPGLVLIKNATTGRWSHVANGSTSATDKMAILHNNDEPLNLLDVNGTAQHSKAKVVVHGYVDPAKVRDTAGNAIDSTGRTGLATATNGCSILFAAA